MVGGAVTHPAATPEPELGSEYSGRSRCEETARRACPEPVEGICAGAGG